MSERNLSELEAKLVNALEVCYKSLSTYGVHDIIASQVERALKEAEDTTSFEAASAIVDREVDIIRAMVLQQVAIHRNSFTLPDRVGNVISERKAEILKQLKGN